jgi:hypothetical protein
MGLLEEVTTSGKIKKNALVLLYGPEKVGKSTFASDMPAPYFICGEDGTNELDVSRAKPKDWIHLKKILKALNEEDHNYKTVVFDTIDWLEQLQLRHLKSVNHVENVKALGGGWGAYKDILKTEWHNMFNYLDLLREKMNILFLAHCTSKKFSDPLNSCEYDKYELKMDYPEVSSVFKEYVDAILFANFETSIKKDKQTKKVRAYGDNTRVLYTERTHAFDAGNRHGMPNEMELDAKKAMEYINRDDDKKCKDLIKEIGFLLSEINQEEYAKTVKSYVDKNKKNEKKLNSTVNKLKIKLSEGE